jgi:ribosomal protein L30/L7E
VDNDAIRGMIFQVRHLVKVEDAPEGQETNG